jgi:hypothetical protein
MAKKEELCMVDGCDREAKVMNLCKRCYDRMRYWELRSMKDKLARINQIRTWESSLELQLSVRRSPRRK